MHRGTALPRGQDPGISVPKIMLLGLGWVCVALGIVGIVLPVLPTTPFLLVAAWAFARSSPRFREWLVGHKTLGPYVNDWNEYGAIPTRAKVLAIAVMSASSAWLFGWSGLSVPIVTVAGLCMLGAAVFILTRPNTPSPD